jgi:hypothetical protein
VTRLVLKQEIETTFWEQKQHFLQKI